MGILDLIKNAFVTEVVEEENDSSLPKPNSRRMHERFLINAPELCSLETSDGTSKLVIHDLSYKACYVELLSGDVLDTSVHPAPMVLNALTSKYVLSVQSIRKRKAGWVVVFSHETETELLNLSYVMDPMRNGSTAVEIPEDTGKRRQGVHRKRYIGDGPFDLVVERDDAGEIKFVMVTLRRGDVYGTVIWENGQVLTKKNLDRQGVGARMAQTADPDRDLILGAAVSCLALKYADGHQVARLFKNWLVQHT
jgi:hypothetical protein